MKMFPLKIEGDPLNVVPAFVPWKFVEMFGETLLHSVSHTAAETLQDLADAGGVTPHELIIAIDLRNAHAKTNIDIIGRLWCYLYNAGFVNYSGDGMTETMSHINKRGRTPKTTHFAPNVKEKSSGGPIVDPPDAEKQIEEVKKRFAAGDRVPKEKSFMVANDDEPPIVTMDESPAAGEKIKELLNGGTASGSFKRDPVDDERITHAPFTCIHCGRTKTVPVEKFADESIDINSLCGCLKR